MQLKTSNNICKKKFGIKDLGKLKYFLGIEIAHSKKGLFLSQRKYVLDLLQETGKLGCKPVDTPIESNTKLGPNDGEVLTDISQFQRLVG
jgi:Reverse transcriptase (RNA-dependent DNA polymerase)